MKIEIWSDFACPYCYIGEKKLEKALEEFGDKVNAEISFKSFQLDPNAEVRENAQVIDINDHMAKKYGISYERAKGQNDSIVNAAAELGLKYRFDILKRNNTSMAHQIAKFAKDEDKEKALVNRFFKAYFEEGADIGNRKTLLALSEEVGLDIGKVEEILDKRTFLERVNADQEQAMKLGISGVPFFIINNKVTVSGAQSVANFKEALLEAQKI